jgi:hypothetical protein
MRHPTRLGSHLRAISVTALVMAHLSTLAAPAWAQGGTTLSSAAAAALGEYQAIEKRATALQHALQDPAQRERALVGWQALIHDLQVWGVHNQIPLGNDTTVVGKLAPIATVASPDASQLCVVQHQSPPSAPAPGIRFWVVGGNTIRSDKIGGWSLKCGYLVTPIPTPDNEDWMNGEAVKMWWDLKQNVKS